MRSKLYRSLATGKLYTFADFREAYIVKYNCEIDPHDDSILEVIREAVASGKIAVVYDPLIHLLNEICDFYDSWRHFSDDEVDEANRELYIGIMEGDAEIIKETIDSLKGYAHKWADRLIKRLEEITEGKA